MKAKGTKRIMLNFKGQRNGDDSDIRYAANCYGFTFKDGSLKSEIGMETAKCNYANFTQGSHTIAKLETDYNETVSDIFLYRRVTSNGYDDRLICKTNEDLIYQIPLFSDGSWGIISNVMLSGNPCSVCLNSDGNDVVLLSSDENYLILLNDATVNFNRQAPRFSSMTFHNERIFATTRDERNRVWFSDDFNPLNWNISTQEGGYIDFRDEYGELIQVISFMDYVFVFKENAIMRIIAYADQTEFSVTKVAVNVGRILRGSIVLCGEMIYFLTPDGLYGFDGYSVKEIDTFLPTISDYSNLTSCAIDDKYYYAARVCGDGEEVAGVNNILVEYDLKEKSYTVLKNLNVKKLLTVSLHHFNGVYVVLDSSESEFVCMLNKSGQKLGSSIEKKWISVKSNFSSSYKKVLKSINIYTISDIVFTVIADGNRYNYRIKGRDAYQKVLIGRSGYELSFEISSDVSTCNIKPIELNFDVVE